MDTLLAIVEQSENLAAFHALRDTNARTRLLAIEALSHMEPAGGIVVAALLEAMHDPDDDVRACAASALGKIRSLGPKTSEAISYLLEACYDPCNRVCEAAHKSLDAIVDAIVDEEMDLVPSEDHVSLLPKN